jgi:cytoskeleton protein RodZ
MSETAPQTDSPAPASPGTLLRQARQAQGLHIGALAAAIKVSVRKLEMLEADRFDELPDATFTRALAQTVCRTLKVDAGPILALLPKAASHRLEHVSEGLNAPFTDRPGRVLPGDWSMLARPALWAPAALLLAAAGVYLMPAGLWPVGREATSSTTTSLPASAPASAVPAAADTAAVAPSSAASATVETVFSAPADAVTSTAAGRPGAPLQLRVTAESWIEVVDAQGQPLLSRLLLPGETVGLDGAMPLRVKIGNAAMTQLTFRGRPLELAPYTRDNVARLELK